MKTQISILLLLISLSGIYGLYQDDSKTCQSCKHVFSFISNVTTNGDDNVKNSLINLCSEYSYLPGKQTKVWCTKAINKFFHVMSHNLNVSTVCYDIKACKDDLDNGIREYTSFTPDTDCEFCNFVATKVKEIIVGGPTEIEAKALFEDACHYLKQYESTCSQLFDQYIDDLFDFVKQTFQPTSLCKSLWLCPKKTGVLSETPNLTSPMGLVNILPVNFSLFEDKPVTKNLSTNVNCAICKKIVKIIQRQLQDNATDQQIVNVLTEVCEILPKEDVTKCKQVVTDYANSLIQVLTQDVDSDMACTLVGLCVPQNFYDYLKGHYLKSNSKVNKNTICIECELIAHFIQNELYNYKNEEQIEEFIEHHLCSKMSLFINETDCNTFIQQYGPIIMQTIAQELFDPTTLCFKELNVCHKPKQDKQKIMAQDIILTKQNEKCKMCKEIVKSLHAAENIDNQVDLLIENSCKNLSKPLTVECGLMIKAFGPYFFEMIDRYDNENDICKSIDICMTPGHVHLLGGHKCTYGPSYWCHSAAHAESCKASTYCRKKVWKAVE